MLSDSIWLYSSHILLALEKNLMSQRLQSAGKVTLLCMCLRNVTRPLYHGCAKVACFLLVQCVSPLICLGVHISFGNHFLFSALTGVKAQEKKQGQMGFRN